MQVIDQNATVEDLKKRYCSNCNTVDKHIMVFDLETETYIAELTFLEN